MIERSEYLAYSYKIPSYLYRVFKTVDEDIFPADLNIKMSLTKTDGMLLYSVDRHVNQLTVSLKNTIPAVFVIDLNGQKLSLTLPELCRCDHCLYEILDLQIYIRDSTMYLSCNDGDTKIVKLGPDKHVNKGRPMPYDQSEISEHGANGAQLWLVNFRQDKDVSPKSDQLSGCIFNVSYNHREIEFTNITDNIRRTCAKTCIDDICNGGLCYETYNTVPVCNCTRTFLNGRYCNDSITALNVRSKDHEFIFSAFKLSWNGSATEIMKLENRIVLFRVCIRGERLVVEYLHKLKHLTRSRGMVMKKDDLDREYIMVGVFHDSYVDIQVYNNGYWYHYVIKTENDLSRELFDSLELRSGDGVIDLAIKHSQKDYKWDRIDIRDVIQLDGNSSQSSDTSNGSVNTIDAVQVDRHHSHTIGLYILLALVMVVVISAAVFVLYFVLRRVRRGRVRQEMEHMTYNLLRPIDSL